MCGAPGLPLDLHVGLIEGDMADIRLEMETHFFGSLNVTRAFAPVIAAQGGGAVLNVLSLLSWAHYPDYGGYGAGKAADSALTDVAAPLQAAPSPRRRDPHTRAGAPDQVRRAREPTAWIYLVSGDSLGSLA
jgi:NAD(P)-dependent dehydrogenase (short-subunit alcohol dehydrogenase family)